MRSATLYFNGTLYRKTLARFWPLWAGYGVIWLFFIPLNMLNMYFNRYSNSPPYRRMLNQALNLPEMATFGLFLAGFFAILCAMAVFGYLYNSRSSCWFHALPMRREALFTTQYLAGLSFLLLPQLVTAALTAMVELAFLPMDSWGKALYALLTWLLAQSGICLFFFSFAAFCAMFTGNILALPAFYCIFNVLADVIYTLLDGLFHEFFYGYAGSAGTAQIVEYLTPAYALKDALVLFGSSEEGQRFRSPGTVAVYAAVGVALALVSLYVYRRRHAETAGDVVSIPLVRPLFKYGVSFCAGLCLGMFTAAFFSWSSVTALIPCVLVWSVVGYFVAEMLLRKSFRVLKTWKGSAVMTAVMLVLCLGCMMDLFGVETRVPKLNQVEQLSVYFNTGYPNDDGASLSTTITDPESIQKFLELHQAVVDDRDRLDWNSSSFTHGDDCSSLQLEYTLKGGSSLHRRYSSIPLYQEDLDKEGSFTYLAQQLVQDRELVAQAYDFEARLNGYRLTGAWLDCLKKDGEIYYDNVYVDNYAQELWDAVQQDFAEGNIGVRWLFDSGRERNENTYHTDLIFGLSAYQRTNTEGYTVQVSPNGYDIDNTLTITLSPQARRTLAVLEKTGIFEEGYSLAEHELDYIPQYPDTTSW